MISNETRGIIRTLGENLLYLFTAYALTFAVAAVILLPFYGVWWWLG